MISIRRVLITAILSVVAVATAGDVSARASSALHFELPVQPGAGRHAIMLQYPPYLALAVENAGVNRERLRGIQIQDPSALRYRTATLRFVKRSASIYSYEATIEWDIGMMQTSLALQVEVDVAKLQDGKVDVRVFLPLATLMPKELLDRIEARLRDLADANLQQAVLKYLDGIRAGREGNDMDAILNQILVQAYNRRTTAVRAGALREPGDAEPLSDQLLLLATLLIWLIIVPGIALGRYIWRRVKLRRTVG